jgi:dihydropteroate synthase
LSQDILILSKTGLKEMLRGVQQDSLRCGNQLIELKTPVVMGILNVTPDSFYAGSRVNNSIDSALKYAEKMLEEGARILDVGGMSTRPGAGAITVDEEVDRVVPVIKHLSQSFPQAIISVDTYRAKVAEESIKAGATIVNDISGGQLDEAILDVVAKYNAAYVLMHMRGTPADMQYQTDYHDLVGDLIKYFVNRLNVLHRKGIQDIMLDPGFGFAKALAQNYQLIDQLGIFRMLGYPILIGISRKSTLSKTIGRPVEDTLEATTALHMAALQKGASILRVHDVRPAVDTIAVFDQLRAANTLNNKSLSRI